MSTDRSGDAQGHRVDIGSESVGDAVETHMGIPQEYMFPHHIRRPTRTDWFDAEQQTMLPKSNQASPAVTMKTGAATHIFSSGPPPKAVNTSFPGDKFYPSGTYTPAGQRATPFEQSAVPQVSERENNIRPPVINNLPPGNVTLPDENIASMFPKVQTTHWTDRLDRVVGAEQGRDENAARIEMLRTAGPSRFDATWQPGYANGPEVASVRNEPLGRERQPYPDVLPYNANDVPSTYDYRLNTGDRYPRDLFNSASRMVSGLELKLENRVAQRIEGSIQDVRYRQQRVEEYMSAMILRQDNTDREVTELAERQVKLGEKQEESTNLIKTVLGQTTMIMEHLKNIPSMVKTFVSSDSAPSAAATSIPQAQLQPTTLSPTDPPHLPDPALPLAPSTVGLNSGTSPSTEPLVSKDKYSVDGCESTDLCTANEFDAPALIDKWIDGDLRKLFPWSAISCDKDYEDPSNMLSDFFTHWCMPYPGGGRGKGSIDADRPDRLCYNTKRCCVGVFTCATGTCSYIERPLSRPAKRKTQMSGHCSCDKPVKYISCTVVHRFSMFKGGILFQAEGQHSHARPPSKHLAKEEKMKLKKLVDSNPNATPLVFITGVPGPDGDTTNIMTINDILINPDRLRYEINNLQDSNGSDFDKYKEFVKAHPGFVVNSFFTTLTVISVQTAFMATQLYLSMLSAQSVLHALPINGLISDAAHKFFKNRNHVLMVTSLYCTVLRRWIPALMSFMDGQTAAHYKCHYLTLFRIMYRICQEYGIPFTDILLLMVTDFSEAQRLGFIQAFVEFFTEMSNDERSEEELKRAAEALLKGCSQHFGAQVTRLRKTKAVIPHGRASEFEQLVDSLQNAADPASFDSIADRLLNAFPAVHNWLAWWRRPNVARMIFPAFRTMESNHWESIPDTTNAEESLHSALYNAVGKDHDMLSGLDQLFQFANAMQAMHRARQCGLRIKYGKDEPWKYFAYSYGRTHPSRDPAIISQKKHKNDGRAPDTFNALLIRKTLPQDSNELKRLLRARKAVHLVSYRYFKNSCWLDTSLEVIYRVVEHNPLDFETLFADVTVGSVADNLKHVITERLDLMNGPTASTCVATANSLSRDCFRRALLDSKIVTSIDSEDSLFGWLAQMCMSGKTKDPIMNFASQSYFVPYQLMFRVCKNKSSKPSHFKLTKEAQKMLHFELTSDKHASCKGSVALFLKRHFEIRSEAIEHEVSASEGSELEGSETEASETEASEPEASEPEASEDDDSEDDDSEDDDSESVVIEQSKIKDRKTCWRGSNNCAGQLSIMSCFVTHPICLVLQVPTTTRLSPNGTMRDIPPDQEPTWSFPSVMKLKGEAEDGRPAYCRYEIVARICHTTEKGQSGHFYAYVRDIGKSCFEYDDLSGKLRRLPESRKLDNTIAGTHSQSRSERTTAVVYVLREGIEGQQMASRYIQRQLLEAHGIIMRCSPDLSCPPQFSLSHPDTREVTEEERMLWERVPTSPETIEYTLTSSTPRGPKITPISQPPRGRKRATKATKRVTTIDSSTDDEAEGNTALLGVTENSSHSRPAKRQRKVTTRTTTPNNPKQSNKVTTRKTTPKRKQSNKVTTRKTTPKRKQSNKVTTRKTTPKRKQSNKSSNRLTTKRVTTIECSTDEEAEGNTVLLGVTENSSHSRPAKRQRKVTTPTIVPNRKRLNKSAKRVSTIDRSTYEEAEDSPTLSLKRRPPSEVEDKPDGQALKKRRKGSASSVRQSARGRKSTAASKAANGTETEKGELLNESPAKQSGPAAIQSPTETTPVASIQSKVRSPISHPNLSRPIGDPTLDMVVVHNGEKGLEQPCDRTELLLFQPAAASKPARNLATFPLDIADRFRRAPSISDVESEEPTGRHRGQGVPTGERRQYTPVSDDDGSDKDEGPFKIKCRCGAIGNVSVLEEDIIRCDECHLWSHQACQYRGWAFYLGPKDRFLCNVCYRHNYTTPRQYGRGVWDSLDAEAKARVPLKRRIRPGLGVLVLFNKYWYPGRVIDCPAPKSADQTYAIKIWRGCKLALPERGIVHVRIHSIRSDLWGDRKLRRKTRLGSWELACINDEPYDVMVTMAHFNNVPSDLDNILGPHLPILVLLLRRQNYDLIELQDIPALNYYKFRMQQAPPAEKKFGPLRYVTINMIADDVANVSAWILSRLEPGPKQFTGEPVFFHALTLFESHHTGSTHLEAFRQIISGVIPEDVDRECVEYLEERMFEVSKRAGAAGRKIWGNAVGNTQYGFDPYGSVLHSWIDENVVFTIDDERLSDAWSIGSYRDAKGHIETKE